MSDDQATKDPISTFQRVLVWVFMLVMPVAVAFLAWMISVFVKPDWRTVGLGVEVPAERTFWLIVGGAFLAAAILAVIVLARLPSSVPVGQAFLFEDLLVCPECGLSTVPDSGECQFCDADLEGARKVTDPDAVESTATKPVEEEDESPTMLQRLALWNRENEDEKTHEEPDEASDTASDAASDAGSDEVSDDGEADEPAPADHAEVMARAQPDAEDEELSAGDPATAEGAPFTGTENDGAEGATAVGSAEGPADSWADADAADTEDDPVA